MLVDLEADLGLKSKELLNKEVENKIIVVTIDEDIFDD